MAYFSNPHTEEELKEQFRQLLIKNDYRNPKNERLIKEIRKEYDERLLQIKRANGYQTFGDKANNLVKNTSRAIQNYSDKVEQERIREQQRVQQLRNKRYTKQEYTNLLVEEKKCIDIIVQKAVRNETNIYKAIKAKSKLGDYVVLYNYFMTYGMASQDENVIRRIRGLREELEYATEHLAQSKKHYDNLLIEIETLMGKYVNECIIKYEDMYLDPISIQNTDSMYKVSKHTPKTWSSTLHLVFTVPAYILLVLSVLIGLTIDEAGFVLSILCVVWLVIMEAWYLLVVKPHEKKKNRVRTRSQAMQEESFATGLAHLISALFR